MKLANFLTSCIVAGSISLTPGVSDARLPNIESELSFVSDEVRKDVRDIINEQCKQHGFEINPYYDTSTKKIHICGEKDTGNKDNTYPLKLKGCFDFVLNTNNIGCIIDKKEGKIPPYGVDPSKLPVCIKLDKQTLKIEKIFPGTCK